MSTSKRNYRTCNAAVGLVFAALALVHCDTQQQFPEASVAPTSATEPSASASEALTTGTRSIIVNSDSSGLQVSVTTFTAMQSMHMMARSGNSDSHIIGTVRATIAGSSGISQIPFSAG